jgi:hypothetical protein
VRSPFNSLSSTDASAQFPGVFYVQDIAGKSNLFRTSYNALGSDRWVPTPERENQLSRSASSRDRLHDAVFAGLIARFSLTEVDNMPDDTSTPADVEALIDEYSPVKSDKSFAHAIDTHFAVPRHGNE